MLEEFSPAPCWHMPGVTTSSCSRSRVAVSLSRPSSLEHSGHNSTFRRPQAGLPEHEELAMGPSEVRPYVDWSRGESASAI